MSDIFSVMPPFLLWPSYRSTLAVLVYLIGPCLSGTYMAAARGVLYVKRLFDGKAVRRSNDQRKKVFDYTTKGKIEGAEGTTTKQASSASSASAGARGGTKKNK